MSRAAQLVSLEVEDGVAVVTLHRTPLNTLTPEVLGALFVQLRRAHHNADVKAIVLTGADDNFCAGFDFTLFGTPQMDETLAFRQEAVKEAGALLEGGSKPTVAAIGGACLGGGCELAMACNARVAAKGAQLGLPEVRLGLIPGLGGTQRLPRLVGMEQALNLMMSGSMVSADDALAIGLVDKVVPSAELLAAARAAALELAAAVAAGTAGARRKTLQLSQHMQQSGEGFAAAVAALQATKEKAQRTLAGQQHYDALIDAVATGLAEGAAAGLQKEGEGFRAACRSRAHRITLHLFKAQKALKHQSGLTALLTQAYLFLGMVFMWFYVRWAYVTTSFMIGYNKARRRNQAKGKDAEKEKDKRASSSSAAGSSRRRK